jgi:hypothetical protein
MKRRRGTDADDFGVPTVQPPGPLFAAALESDYVLPVVEGGRSGCFAESRIAPTPLEQVVGEMIWRHQGRGNAIALDAIAAATGKDARTIKGVVEQLVVSHRARIGGYRGAAGESTGYAVIVDAEDLAAAVGPYRSQIFAMWRRLRVLLGKHELAELLGQLRLED